MDQRDESTGMPTFYYAIYEGGEISPGFLIGWIEIEAFVSPGIQRMEPFTAENIRRQYALYRGIFTAREGDLPYQARICCEYYSGPAWVIARLLGFLHEAQPQRGPFQAIPCSRFPGWYRPGIPIDDNPPSSDSNGTPV